MTSISARFWSKVCVKGPDECWDWQRGKDANGYGRFAYKGRNVRAHRFAYELTFGPIPKGQGYHGTCILHKCDNPSCCNPSHYSIGTHNDNMKDMASKSRAASGIGTKNPNSKLTASQVLEIRGLSLYIPQKDLATMYNVTSTTISDVISRKRWNHI